MSTELKPCPSCKSTAIVSIAVPRGQRGVQYMCQLCETCGPRKTGYHEAAESWNDLPRRQVLNPMSEPPESMLTVLAALTQYECVSVIYDEDLDQWYDLETYASDQCTWAKTDPALYFGWMHTPKYSIEGLTNDH